MTKAEIFTYLFSEGKEVSLYLNRVIERENL